MDSDTDIESNQEPKKTVISFKSVFTALAALLVVLILGFIVLHTLGLFNTKPESKNGSISSETDRTEPLSDIVNSDTSVAQDKNKPAKNNTDSDGIENSFADMQNFMLNIINSME